MKKVNYMLLALFILITLVYGEEGIFAESAKPNLFVGVIRDSSPASERSWNIQQALNIEVVHSLKAGDKLKEWVAQPGKPSMLIDAVISENDFEKSQVINKISGISKELLFSTDVAKCMEPAFDDFSEKDKDCQCLLIIITKGQISNEQVAQILRYAGAFKARKWPVCITYDEEDTNRKFLVAGNNKEFDIQAIGKALLAVWIDSIRSTATSKKPKDTAIQEAKSEATVKQSIEIKGSEGKPSLIPVNRPGKPIEVKIVELPRAKVLEDVNKPNKQVIPEKPIAKKANIAGDKLKDGKKHKYSALNVIPIIILAAIVLGALGLILYSTRDSASKLNSADQIDKEDNKQYRLIAFVFDQRYDLGPLDAIGEITVGKGIGSTVYIDKESIEDKHLRIFKNCHGLKVQNLATAPIIVNGSKLAHRRKTNLYLPADIELTSDVALTVLSEPVEIGKEENNNETENI